MTEDVSKFSILIYTIVLGPLGRILPPYYYNKIIKLIPQKYLLPIVNRTTEILAELDPTLTWNLLEENLERIGYNIKEGSKYKSTEEEVNENLSKIPSLAPYRPYLLRYCERKRKEVGLPV